MALSFLLNVPLHGDGRSGSPQRWNRGDWNPAAERPFAPSVVDERPGRFTYADYLTQVARGAELAGFNGLYVPYDPDGDDTWIVASALAREASRLTVVPEFPPGFASAVYTAKLAFTFQRFFAGRLGLKLALEDHSEVALARADELLTVITGVWGREPFSYAGAFFQSENSALFASHSAPPVRVDVRPHPAVYLDGESDEALELSARHADVHLFDSVDFPNLRDLLARHRALSAHYGRDVAYGIRLAIVAREYESEAWTRLQRLWNDVHPGDAAGFERRRFDELLWHGFGELGYGADAGLVGTFRAVGSRINAYADLGISTFVLDATPRVEQAYRLGENLLPLVATPRWTVVA